MRRKRSSLRAPVRLLLAMGAALWVSAKGALRIRGLIYTNDKMSYNTANESSRTSLALGGL